MKIIVLGAGPVGLTTALSFSIWGHDVLCVDTDSELIQQLSNGETDYFETDLAAQLKLSLSQKKIQFSNNFNSSLEFSDIYFIAIGTPSLNDGSCDMNQLNQCVRQIIDTENKRKKIVVIKSTVPPQTNLNFSKKYQNSNVVFVSNPEFLREGTALHDALHPDRILIGSEHSEATEILSEIYKPIRTHSKYILTDPTTAELSKYAANAFLAARISLINEFAKLSDFFDADITSLSEIIGCDPRIGPDFLKSGIGYGGSCFPKDVNAILQFSAPEGLEVNMVQAIQKTNDHQIKNFTAMIKKNIPQKRISIWGAAFKPNTNDVRESPALKVIDDLLADDFVVHLHDPQLSSKIHLIYDDEINKNQIVIFEEKFNALKNCYALAICTDWNEYVLADITEIKKCLMHPMVFDGRNIFKSETMKNNGFKYFSVGQKK